MDTKSEPGNQFQGTSKARSYQVEIASVLQQFDKCKEWADLIRNLLRLAKVLQKYSEMSYLPQKIAVATRVAQCMNASLPSGVHLKAIEVYHLIFNNIGHDKMALDLPLYSMGIFPLFRTASMAVKPKLLELFYENFMPLGRSLIPVLPGLVVSLLPGIEERNSENYESALSLLDRLCLASDPHMFFTCVWRALGSSAEVRTAAVHYLMLRVPKPGTGKVKDISLFLPAPASLAVNSIMAGLDDDSNLVVRAILDLMIAYVPFAEPLFDNKTMVRLAERALGVLSRREMALTRRFYLWILGESFDEDTFVCHTIDILVKAFSNYFTDKTRLDDIGFSKFFFILLHVLEHEDIGVLILERLLILIIKVISRMISAGGEEEAKIRTASEPFFERVNGATVLRIIGEKLSSLKGKGKKLCHLLDSVIVVEELLVDLDSPEANGVAELAGTLASLLPDAAPELAARLTLLTTRLLMRMPQDREDLRMAVSSVMGGGDGDRDAPLAVLLGYTSTLLATIRKAKLQKESVGELSAALDSSIEDEGEPAAQPAAAGDALPFLPERVGNTAALGRDFEQLQPIPDLGTNWRAFVEKANDERVLALCSRLLVLLLGIFGGNRRCGAVFRQGSTTMLHELLATACRGPDEGSLVSIDLMLHIIKSSAPVENLSGVSPPLVFASTVLQRLVGMKPALVTHIVQHLWLYIEEQESPRTLAACALLTEIYETFTGIVEGVLSENLVCARDESQRPVQIAKFQTFWRALIALREEPHWAANLLFLVVDYVVSSHFDTMRAARRWLNSAASRPSAILTPYLLLLSYPFQGLRSTRSAGYPLVPALFDVDRIIHAFQSIGRLLTYGGEELLACALRTPVAESILKSWGFVEGEDVWCPSDYTELVQICCLAYMQCVPSLDAPAGHGDMFPRLKGSACDVLMSLIRLLASGRTHPEAASLCNRAASLADRAMPALLRVFLDTSRWEDQPLLLDCILELLSASLARRPLVGKKRGGSSSSLGNDSAGFVEQYALYSGNHPLMVSVPTEGVDLPGGLAGDASVLPPQAVDVLTLRAMEFLALFCRRAAMAPRSVVGCFGPFVKTYLLLLGGERARVGGDLLGSVCIELSTVRDTMSEPRQVHAAVEMMRLLQSVLDIFCYGRFADIGDAGRKETVSPIPEAALATRFPFFGIGTAVKGVFASHEAGSLDAQKSQKAVVKTMLPRIAAALFGLSKNALLRDDPVLSSILDILHDNFMAEMQQFLFSTFSVAVQDEEKAEARQVVEFGSRFSTFSLAELFNLAGSVLEPVFSARKSKGRRHNELREPAVLGYLADYVDVCESPDPSDAAAVWPAFAALAKRIIQYSTHPWAIILSLKIPLVLIGKVEIPQEKKFRKELGEVFIKLVDIVAPLLGETWEISANGAQYIRPQLAIASLPFGGSRQNSSAQLEGVEAVNSPISVIPNDSFSMADSAGASEADVAVPPTPVRSDKSGGRQLVRDVKSYYSLKLLTQLNSPKLMDFLESLFGASDRIASLLDDVVAGLFKHLQRPSSVHHSELAAQILVSLSEKMVYTKLYKKEIVELFNSSAFFLHPVNVVVDLGKVLNSSLSASNSSLMEMLGNSIVPQPVMFLNRESELMHRTKLLKRLAFCLLCGSKGQYNDSCRAIVERVAESLKMSGSTLHEHAFLVVRCLLYACDEDSISPYWPIIVSEMIRTLSNPTAADELLVSVMRTIDVLMILGLDTFYMFEWMFIDDKLLVAESKDRGHFIPYLRALAQRGTAEMLSRQSLPPLAISSRGAAPQQKGNGMLDTVAQMSELAFERATGAHSTGPWFERALYAEFCGSGSATEDAADRQLSKQASEIALSGPLPPPSRVDKHMTAAGGMRMARATPPSPSAATPGLPHDGLEKRTESGIDYAAETSDVT